MSSPEIKEVIGSVSETSLACKISTVSGENSNGGSFVDSSEILFSRFDSLRLVSACGGVAFYVGREVGAGAQDGLVAVKVFTGHAGRQLELFQLETCAAAMLSHRNIIKANPPEEIGGVHFSIMEHRSGTETLKDLLDREGWLDPSSAIGIARQIADALDYAHGLGVLHLGIRPETILIDHDGTAELTDFGLEDRSELAWAHIERSRHCPVQYASPEQASGGPPDSRSDLYSLGVVLYQMLTDRLPADSEDPDSVRQKLVTSPLSPHLYCENIPLSVSAIINRLLERDPWNRFRDAASVRASLDMSVSAFTVIADQKSEDSVQQVEEAPQEDVDPDTFSTASSRQSWETPTISVVNPPGGGISAVESFQSASAPKSEIGKPADERGETVYSLSAIPVKYESLQPARDRQQRPVSQAMILCVTLALAAIGGIIVLAPAHRAMFPGPTALESPAVERGADAGIAMPPAEGPGEKSSVRNPQSVTDQEQLENVRSATTRPGVGTANSASSAVRSRRLRVLRPPVSPRLRQAKRKPWRPERYWRNYPYNRGR